MTILKTIMLCLSISLLEALNPAYIRWDVIIYHFFILTTGKCPERNRAGLQLS